jgi:ABC-type multidrug transport system fused ATPase/permease subunit
MNFLRPGQVAPGLAQSLILQARPHTLQSSFLLSQVNITQDAVSFTDVWFNYPGGPTLFKNLSFGLALETRAAIVGPNGAKLLSLPRYCCSYTVQK